MASTLSYQTASFARILDQNQVTYRHGDRARLDGRKLRTIPGVRVDDVLTVLGELPQRAPIDLQAFDDLPQVPVMVPSTRRLGSHEASGQLGTRRSSKARRRGRGPCQRPSSLRRSVRDTTVATTRGAAPFSLARQWWISTGTSDPSLRRPDSFRTASVGRVPRAGEEPPPFECVCCPRGLLQQAANEAPYNASPFHRR